MRIEKNYRPIDLARVFNLHPNTIRLYEKQGFLSLSKRDKNGHRLFSDLHVLQVKICRCIFGYSFTNRKIRDAGNKVMWASGKKQWQSGKEYAIDYLKIIENEYKLAQRTADILHHWATDKNEGPLTSKQDHLSRKEAAELFGVTVETVRNWERNRLIKASVTGNLGEIRYDDEELEKMTVIYMLRQAGYSITAIQKSIMLYEQGRGEQVLKALNEPVDQKEIPTEDRWHFELSVGDRWQTELKKILAAAEKIPAIFDELSTL
ncbi:MerR family transcriptional regulator [Enterococcus raffinosus]